MSNTPRKKTAAQHAWRRLRDRDIAAALSGPKRPAARDITMPPGVLSATTTPDTVHVGALGMKE